MPFERYDPENKQQNLDDPQLTIYTTLAGRINAAADLEYFEGHESVTFLVDRDRDLLAIEPAGDDGDYQLSRGDGDGADLATTYALRDEFGIDEDALDETQYVPLEWDDDYEWAIADLSTVLAAAGRDEGSAEDTDDSAVQPTAVTMKVEAPATPGPDVWAAEYTSKPEVERYVIDTFRDDPGEHEFEPGTVAEDLGISSSWAGRAFVQLQKSDAPVIFESAEGAGDPSKETTYVIRPNNDLAAAFTDEEGGAADAGADEGALDSHVVDESGGDGAVPEPDDIVNRDRIREVAGEVETLSELATELGLSDGEARLQARDAGVLTDIRDDRKRMGASD